MIKRLIPFMLVSVTIALAQPGRGFGGARMALEKELNLTTEQQVQVNKLRTAYQTQAIDLRADLQKLHLELREQIRADRPNKRAIDVTLDKISAKRSALQELCANHHLDVRAVLTPEQRQIFDARPFRRGLGKSRGHCRPPL